MNHNNLKSFQQFAKASNSVIKPEDVNVALDIGSRDGEVALYLKKHYPNAKIYAFECNPSAINLCRNRLSNEKEIELIERAVSDVDGTLDFFAIDPEKTLTPHSDGNIGASSLYRASASYPYETYKQNCIKVESVTLESWAKHMGIGCIDVIWMDLQGAELRAIKGMGHLLQKISLLYTEVEYKEIYEGQPLAADVRSFLSQRNMMPYKKFNVWEWFGDELFCRKDLLPWWKRWRLN